VTNPARTSRQFAAIRALRARLGEQSFPPHPTTGAAVVVPVGYTAELPDLGSERLGITLDLDEAATGWARVGPAGRDEEFIVDVWFATMLPGQDDEQVFDRLEVCSGIVQLSVYDEYAQKVRPLGFDGELESGRVSAHRFAIWGAGDGFVGQALVSFNFKTRI
jgi:hypothetical protein